MMLCRLMQASCLLLALLMPCDAFQLTAAAARSRHRSGALVAIQRPGTPGQIAPIKTTDDYHQLLQDATDQNRLVVIKFYASWCRACKAMAPKFERVAEDWPDIEFHEILFDDNKKLCKSLGIKILPFMEIIAGSKGKIEGFSCGPSKISLLVGKLEDTTSQYCGVDDIECTDISNLLPED